VEYDHAAVLNEQLLELFWEIHDPTTMNRQGPDVGTQYRSAIFYHGAKQKAAAEVSLKRLDESGEFGRPIVTQIVPASMFYRAEEYHQRYYERMRIAPHCGIRRTRMAAD
jgi:peptide-methionine (S)-S-oxide reductase